VLGAFKAILDIIQGRRATGRAALVGLEAKWCDWGHPILMVAESGLDERGPWHLDVGFRVWNKGDKPTTIQDAHVVIKGRRFATEHDWRYVDYHFPPVELPPGAHSKVFRFSLTQRIETFSPPPMRSPANSGTD
jgi:hypothetical protein